MTPKSGSGPLLPVHTLLVYMWNDFLPQCAPLYTCLHGIAFANWLPIHPVWSSSQSRWQNIGTTWWVKMLHLSSLTDVSMLHLSSLTESYSWSTGPLGRQSLFFECSFLSLLPGAGKICSTIWVSKQESFILCPLLPFPLSSLDSSWSEPWYCSHPPFSAEHFFFWIWLLKKLNGDLWKKPSAPFSVLVHFAPFRGEREREAEIVFRIALAL